MNLAVASPTSQPHPGATPACTLFLGSVGPWAVAWDAAAVERLVLACDAQLHPVSDRSAAPVGGLGTLQTAHGRYVAWSLGDRLLISGEAHAWVLLRFPFQYPKRHMALAIHRWIGIAPVTPDRIQPLPTGLLPHLPRLLVGAVRGDDVRSLRTGDLPVVYRIDLESLWGPAELAWSDSLLQRGT